MLSRKEMFIPNPIQMYVEMSLLVQILFSPWVFIQGQLQNVCTFSVEDVASSSISPFANAIVRNEPALTVSCYVLR